MSGKINIYFGCILFISLVSCRASRPPVTPVSVTMSASDYINTYKDIAISEMRRTGVPASITLAQGMLESDNGRSSLARFANNHFGIKCHNDWTGQTYRQNDDRRNECFRKYRRPEDSFYDHSDFLKSGSRYNFLFDLDPANYKAWAQGLRRAGYATNPDYAGMIIRKIEENRLYEFDQAYTASSANPQAKGQVKVPVDAPARPAGTSTANPTQSQANTITFGDIMARAPRIRENNRVQYIIVKDGETKQKLEDEFQLLKWELARYNDLKDDFLPVAGQMLYLEPKRDKAEAGTEVHIAAAGDTMYMISQKYAIRLKSLLEMNGMTEGQEPEPGQKILLQGSKPVN
ncbi:MAG: glucosaminidase domain-containing protein [Bacteroidota bacterium]|nr:glucosaminidase domain-containing protein [Bacteroidota bacterium]